MHFFLQALLAALWLLCTPVYAQSHSAVVLADISVLEILNQEGNFLIQYTPDPTDYWQSPKETALRKRGDCEDYALYKLYRALQNGIAPAKLRMLYVRATVNGSTAAHMVLGYYPEPSSADPLILDNLIGSLRPLSKRPDLQFTLSFNGSSVWMADGTLSTRDPRRLFPQWADVLYKAYQEGFPSF